MQRRITNILLVSSLYDSYILEEDGRLHEMLRKEIQDMNLNLTPNITHVSSGHEALELAASDKQFDLIITTLHIEDMHPTRLAKMARASSIDTPIVLLAYDNREQMELAAHHDAGMFDRIFIWQGDFRILVAIIKYIEDRINVENDTRLVGVQSIILIEDNIRFYSTFLPIMFSEIITHSYRLISESINLADRFVRMRARPKILLCSTYEEAWHYYEKYADTILGVISDIDFPRGGVHDPLAGLEFARNVKSSHPDVPILLQSTDVANEQRAYDVGASFLLKNAPTLLQDLRTFMVKYFSFGDFVFRTNDGTEVGRASNLQALEEQLHLVPIESIRYHSERNHFSKWLKARTEFWLAHLLRPRKTSDFPTDEALRNGLIDAFKLYRTLRQQGQITVFNKGSFDPNSTIARIGGGSLGGKARGIGFTNSLLNNFAFRDRFDEVEIAVPSAVILGTDVFDEFLKSNDVKEFALKSQSDSETLQRFSDAKKFPRRVRQQLLEFLELVDKPLAVRSSSLLEDSQYHPFAGVYATHMIPNDHANVSVRLSELLNTIRLVYASMFLKASKDYFKVTSYLLEEEKMAVIVQKMVGAERGKRFYPDFSGVAKSHNFYPIAPQQSEDGIVSVAVGLGKLIVDGGASVRFCPKYPNHLLQFYSTKEALRNNQSEFYALNLDYKSRREVENPEALVTKYMIADAERDGVLSNLASTYSSEDDTVTDGIARNGRRIVTFAPILRQKTIPLASILEMLLEMGTWSVGTPVEIEFAVNLSVPSGKKKEMGILQMRPLVLNREAEELRVDGMDSHQIVCQSNQVLGNGLFNTMHDAIVVDTDNFDRSKSAEVAAEIATINQTLVKERRPYLLLGVGRWGSLDPWLGIPVTWDQIAGASVIVEAGFRDMEVSPSQGSHFFQNITSFMVGYFTVETKNKDSLVDWEWFRSQPVQSGTKFVRHLRFSRPIKAIINSQQHKGIILKPTIG